MRRRSDLNQAEIIGTLRRAGVSVVCLSSVGGGVPDVLCSVAGATCLLEVKNRNGRGSRFTPAEEHFISTWQGVIHVVETAEQALEVLGVRNCQVSQELKK